MRSKEKQGTQKKTKTNNKKQWETYKSKDIQREQLKNNEK